MTAGNTSVFAGRLPEGLEQKLEFDFIFTEEM